MSGVPVFSDFFAFIHQAQQSLTRSMAGELQAVGDGGLLAAGGLIAAAFLYGVVHAAGPGHGKVVISSYLMAEGRRFSRGVMLAVASSLVQALSAIALIGGLALLLGWAAREAAAYAIWLERASYALALMLGTAILARVLWRRFRARTREAGHDAHHHAHAHGHAHDHACAHAALDRGARAGRIGEQLAVIAAIGLRPCTGAILILAFALTQGLFLAGVAATFAMAAGTAITVIALAGGALGLRAGVLRLSGGGTVELALTLAGGLALAAAGGLLLAASFQPAPGGPFALP